MRKIKIDLIIENMRDTREILRLFAYPPTSWEDLLLKRNLSELVGTFILKSNEWEFAPLYENKIKDEFRLNFLNVYYEFAFFKVPIAYLPLAIPALASCIENWLNFRIEEKLLKIKKSMLSTLGKQWINFQFSQRKISLEKLIKEAEVLKIITLKGKDYLERLRKVRNDFIHLNYHNLSKGLLLEKTKDPLLKTLNAFWEKGIEGIKGFLIGGVDSEFLDFVKKEK